jgi:proteic killer suppression protein
MKVEFRDKSCDRLDKDPAYNAGHSAAVVTAFRKRIQFIKAATDERDFREMRSLHYEKLKGDRSHQRSMRLNDQWRLILELDKSGAETVVVVVGIEDYH